MKFAELFAWFLVGVMVVLDIVIITFKVVQKEKCSVCGVEKRDVKVIENDFGVRFNACDGCIYEALVGRVK